MPEKTQNLKEQVALITGATRGIGLAIAKNLASEGCHLILTARDEKALNRVSRELGSTQAEILAQPDQVEKAAPRFELDDKVEIATARFFAAGPGVQARCSPPVASRSTRQCGKCG